MKEELFGANSSRHWIRSIGSSIYANAPEIAGTALTAALLLASHAKLKAVTENMLPKVSHLLEAASETEKLLMQEAHNWHTFGFSKPVSDITSGAEEHSSLAGGLPETQVRTSRAAAMRRSLSKAPGIDHIDQLPNVQFERQLRDGRLTSDEVDYFPGKIIGMTSIDPIKFGEFKEGLSSILRRTAQLASRGSSREDAAKAINDDVDLILVPQLEKMGVAVRSWSETESPLLVNNGNYQYSHEIPLNARVKTPSSFVDINTVGGVRNLDRRQLNQFGNWYRKTDGSMFTPPIWFPRVHIDKLKDEQLLPTEYRTGMFRAMFDGAKLKPETARFIDQTFLDHLKAGKDRVVEAESAINFGNYSQGNEAELFMKTEEMLHFLQSINGNKPLSKYGADLSAELLAHPGNLERLFVPENPWAKAWGINELDIGGIYSSFGIKPPETFMQSYDRAKAHEYMALSSNQKSRVVDLLDVLHHDALRHMRDKRQAIVDWFVNAPAHEQNEIIESGKQAIRNASREDRVR